MSCSVLLSCPVCQITAIDGRASTEKLLQHMSNQCSSGGITSICSYFMHFACTLLVTCEPLWGPILGHLTGEGIPSCGSSSK